MDRSIYDDLEKEDLVNVIGYYRRRCIVLEEEFVAYKAKTERKKDQLINQWAGNTNEPL